MQLPIRYFIEKSYELLWHVCTEHSSMVSCQEGPTCHAYAWQIGPFWQDTPEFIHNKDSLRQWMREWICSKFFVRADKTILIIFPTVMKYNLHVKIGPWTLFHWCKPCSQCKYSYQNESCAAIGWKDYDSVMSYLYNRACDNWQWHRYEKNTEYRDLHNSENKRFKYRNWINQSSDMYWKINYCSDQTIDNIQGTIISHWYPWHMFQTYSQGPFCIHAQPMREGVTQQHHLSFWLGA